MKKILITGGLGFIGFHLINQLFKVYKNPNITVIDNLSSSIIEFGKIYNKLNVIIKDFLETKDLDEGYTDVFHLASPVGSLGILSKNGYVARNIIDLTYKVADCVMRNNAKLLYVSSSEVYGHSGIHREEAVKHIPHQVGTRMEYALGKITSEIILENLNQNHNFKYNIVRPFNVIGEQQCSKIGFVVPTFFENALLGKDIPVFYTGSQKRSFCHVEDVVKAMIALQESDIINNIFNIGNDGNLISILDLARKIKKICHSKSKIIHIDPVAKFGKCYLEAFDKIPNINKITKALYWKPDISLDQSLERLLNFYNSRQMSSEYHHHNLQKQ